MTGVLTALKKALPAPVKEFLKHVYLSALDMRDASARREEMTPPRTMIFVGDGDYKAKGLEFRKLFIQYGGLKPDQRVLDVGCGIGRMAVPLTGYLSARGEYQGFDIVKKGVEWCRENITPRHKNFRFEHSDILNKFYNPNGAFKSSEYAFPLPDGHFDFVFLTSVFTHMFPADVENYLKEISRVLKKGGRCFITLFLITEESAELVRSDRSTQKFIHEIPGCYTTSIENPEAAIAFKEAYIREIFLKCGLAIEEPIRFGSWCGRTNFLSYQDIVIAGKI